MTIWDSVKPVKRPPEATAVELSADQQSLAMKWNDGVSTVVSSRRLRQYCPCAECVEEWSGKRTFEIEKIPAGMKVIEVAPVGNYALAFTFGDMHRTGIFVWEHLRELSS